MVIVASSEEHVGESLKPQPTWQEALKCAIRDARSLCRILQLPTSLHDSAERAARSFPVFAPLEFVGRMESGNPHDPLLRQVLPLADELESIPGYSSDPVGDRAATLTPGLLHKYPRRMLIVTTGACAVHCRYCFRRHFPYEESTASSGQWDQVLSEIHKDESIEEVLLSGGDPLTLPDARLAHLVQQLAQVPHLRRVRIHSRLPIVIPQRVTDALTRWLTGTRLTPFFVIHANHPNEIDDQVAAALHRLSAAGIPVLNQSVLLRGVNDEAGALADLSKKLIDLRVIPYYLHEMDRVLGAHHFVTAPGRGENIIRELRSMLPGYAVPRLVREVAGADSKITLA